MSVSVSRWFNLFALAIAVVPLFILEATAAWSERTLSVAGVTRHYLAYVPESYRAGAATVLLLHGGGQSMRKVVAENGGGSSAWPAIAEREGFLLLVPNGLDRRAGEAAGDAQHWNDLRIRGSRGGGAADDVGFILQMIDHAQSEWGDGTGRTYLTGASNGGMMAYRLLVEASDEFDAAAVWIASLPDGLVIEPLRNPVPLLIGNGTDDPVVRWGGGRVMWFPGSRASIPIALERWIAGMRANARSAQTAQLPNANPDDGCILIRTDFPPHPQGAPVTFIEMRGGGHALPSRSHPIRLGRLAARLIGTQCRDAEGAELSWRFFRQHAP